MMAKRTAPRVATHATSTLITATNLLYCAASYTAQRRIKHGFGWDSLPNLTKTRLASHGRREKQKTYQHKFTAVHIFNICTSELVHKQHTRNHKIIGLHKWSQGYVVQFHTRKPSHQLCASAQSFYRRPYRSLGRTSPVLPSCWLRLVVCC